MTDDRPMALLPWHESPWQRLARTRHEQRLPHALLLTGAAGLGKRRFAQQLAQALNCRAPNAQGLGCGDCHDCRLACADAHPDIAVVEPEAEGRPLTVDAIRELLGKAVLTAETGRRRVFILVPADAMNAAAANALLKTLEEPTPGTLFALVTSRPARLPATIRSRCQQVRFRPPDIDALKQWLADDERLQALLPLLPLVGSAPLRAARLAADGAAAHPAGLGRDLQALSTGSSSPVEVAGKWSQQDPDWFLSLLWLWLADLARLKQCRQPPLTSIAGAQQALSPLLQRVDLMAVHRLLEQVQSLRRALDHNLNPQLMMERLLIDWQRLGSNAARADCHDPNR